MFTYTWFNLIKTLKQPKIWQMNGNKMSAIYIYIYMNNGIFIISKMFRFKMHVMIYAMA